MVEQIGHDRVQGRKPGGDALVRDRGSKRRLAAAGRAPEREPSLRRLREGGRRARRFRERGGALRRQPAKTDAGKRSQVAVALKSRRLLVAGLVLRAATGNGAAEILMPGGQIASYEASVVALPATRDERHLRRRLSAG